MKRTILILILPGLFACLTFQLQAQHLALQPEKMNVFYFNIDNPVEVVIENTACNKVVATAAHGTITMTTDSCTYFYRNNTCQGTLDTIYSGIKEDNKIRWIDTTIYRLKPAPTPVVSASGKYLGNIKKDELLRYPYVFAAYLNLDIDARFIVDIYSVRVLRNDSTIYVEENIDGSKYSDGLIQQISRAETGDIITFFHVQITNAVDGCWGEEGLAESSYIISQ